MVSPPDHPRSGSLRPATVSVTAGRPPREPDQPFSAPITMASTYVAGGDLEYGRYGNPTWTAFETALGELEGGRCLAYSSGMAAVTTLLDLVALGDRVVIPRHSYNGALVQLADLELRGALGPFDAPGFDEGGAGVGGVRRLPDAPREYGDDAGDQED